MAIQGSVPAAVLGVVDVGKDTPGARKGVFESTQAASGRYQTVLTLVNQPVTIVHGANAGFGSVEIYDFGKGLLDFRTAVADLTVAKPTGTNPATGIAYVYALAADHDGFLAIGTTAQTDTTPPASTRADLAPSTAYAAVADAVTAGDLVSTTPALFNGTATAKKVFLNVVVDSTDEFVGSVDNSVILVSGTITLQYADGGGLD